MTVDGRRGRPRDARVDEAIADAAVSVLADRGPGGFTVDEVAARAGCGKATVYRRWPSRAELLLDTADRLGLEPPSCDTGSVRDDMVEVMVALGTKMRDTTGGRMLPGIVAEASVNDEMARVLRTFIVERRDRPRRMIRRGIERGELPADTDVEMLLDALGGTVIFRELIARAPTDRAWCEAFVDRVLAGFGLTAPGGRAVTPGGDAGPR